MTMIESSSYFEAYRPFLSALQEINKETMPFQRYIVGHDEDFQGDDSNVFVDTPEYLKRYQISELDLQSLKNAKLDDIPVRIQYCIPNIHAINIYMSFVNNPMENR